MPSVSTPRRRYSMVADGCDRGLMLQVRGNSVDIPRALRPSSAVTIASPPTCLRESAGVSGCADAGASNANQVRVGLTRRPPIHIACVRVAPQGTSIGIAGFRLTLLTADAKVAVMPLGSRVDPSHLLANGHGFCTRTIEMLELRTYTLASDEALDRYASVHWGRHITSLAAFGITTRHIWKQIGGDKPRLVALVEYAQGTDPEDVSKRYMDSAEFRADMSGFPMAGIVHVESTFLVPAPTDPSS